MEDSSIVSLQYDVSSLEAFVMDYCLQVKTLHYVRLLNACNKYTGTKMTKSDDGFTKYHEVAEYHESTEEIFAKPIDNKIHRSELFVIVHKLINNGIISIDEEWNIVSLLSKL